MIPSSAAKLLGNLGCTSSGGLVKTLQGVLSTAQVRSECNLCSSTNNKKLFQTKSRTDNVVQGMLDVTQVRHDSYSCFVKDGKAICTAAKVGCAAPEPCEIAAQKIKDPPPVREIFCGFSKDKFKPCPPEPCVQNCCPNSCRVKDPCCGDKCGHVVCPAEKELKCCNNRPCCPNDDFGKNQCCQAPPPPKTHRCDMPGGCDDPCCSRIPLCPNLIKPGCDEVLGDPLERPCPTHPCDVAGSGCDYFEEASDCCEVKAKRDACEMGRCPRKEKCTRKTKSTSNHICLNLDPNWPPKRQCCSGEPEKDPCTPCQRDCKQKEKFDDGLS